MLKKNFSSPFVFFPVFTLVVFWPLSLHLFSLKNDALTYYYPVRTLISDALNNHELPLWTPYINMGYPLHADMQSCAWNPIVWIFSFLTHYSLASFHFELLFYVCFAGIGFYYVCRDYGWNKSTAITIAVAYQLSGFMLDSAQFFVCLSSACYLPYIFLFYRRLLLQQQIKNALLTALFLYLFFTGGYPSLFVITSYFLAAYTLFIYFSSEIKKTYFKKIIFPLACIAGVFILLSLPAIISYVQHLPFIERGKTQSLDFVLENSMAPFSTISFISPFSTTATTSLLNTDLLMRNTYIGIIPFLFLLYGIFNKTIRKNKEVKFFLITGLIMYGLALGSHFFLRQLAYYILPLMNTFRHPALFRLFGIFCFLLIAGFSMNAYQKNMLSKKPSGIIKIITAFFAVIVLLTIFIICIGRADIFKSTIDLSQLKNSFTQLNFYQRFLIQLPIILLILLSTDLLLRRRKPFRFIVIVSLLDLFIAAQLNIPITVIGAKKFTEVENIINRNPVKFPLPDNASIEENSYNTIDSLNLIGSKIPFIKKIGRNDYYITPGNLILQDEFYTSALVKKVFKNPPLYYTDTNHNDSCSINITQFSANKMEADVFNQSAGQLVYLQNIYPGWQVYIDGNQSTIKKANISFMAVNVPAGKHHIIFTYRPRPVIYAWYISISTLISVILLIIIYSRRKPEINKLSAI